MNILVFNCGSSSQGFKVYHTNGNSQPQVIASGKARNVAIQTQAGGIVDWIINGSTGSLPADLPTHRLAAERIITLLKENHIPIDAIGHRFVHGGTFFDHTAKVDKAVMERLRRCLPLAPIHNPNSYSVIEFCERHLPGVPQYAVFDTSFHAGMPEVSRQYAIPQDLAQKYGFHKYGFHGLSYQYVSTKTAELMGRPLESLKLILCHLGTGGSSVAAMKNGTSLDTSMGFSPLAGLVMSTRCGDLDPEIPLEMVLNGSSPEQVSGILNHQSGLIGLSGFSSNLQEIIEEAEKGNARCQLAYEVYVQRLRHYLGAFTWMLNGADAIIFTDEVGLKSWKLREKACSGVENLGVEIDKTLNQHAPADKVTQVNRPTSKTQIWVIPTDEEVVIFKEVVSQL